VIKYVWQNSFSEASHSLSVTAELLVLFSFFDSFVFNFPGDHLSRKPGNVGEFDSCEGNVRDFTISHGNVREIILSGKSRLKLFLVSCIFA